MEASNTKLNSDQNSNNEVVVKNLGFHYPNSSVNIFNNVNMHVPGGKFVCLLGQSGSGKSTLLRLLAGLETPSSGEIIIGGEKHRGPELEKAVVFQDYGLFPWMTAGDNIVLALEQKFPKLSKKERVETAKSMMERVGLNVEVFNKLPKELSGGMKQRCAIARSFAIDAPILLMDEPFGALDAVTRATLQDLLLQLCAEKNKKTVFFVTHDVEEALYLAERIYVIGQSGNDIIYECDVRDNERVLRGQSDSEETSNLRNKLVEVINYDVTSRME